MSIRINKKQCIGCQKCMEVCPGSLITLVDKKAFMKYPKDCWGCVSCVKECPVEAIEFFLGADIGGNGSTMTVVNQDDKILWKIQKYDGTTEEIEINRKNANKY